MQRPSYLKNVAKAVFKPVFKSLYGGFPAFGAGFEMLTGKPFSWEIGNNSAYSNKIYYSATNILVGKLIEAPITFSKRKSSTSRKFDKFYSKTISNEKRFVLKQLALIELEDHELNILFDNPNSYQSGIEMMEDFWHNYAGGDGFLYFETLGELSRSGKPIAVHSINRNRVFPVKSNDDWDTILAYDVTTLNGKQVRIDKKQVLHLKHWNPNLNDLKGYGIDVAASMDIALNNANSEMQGVTFKNGGRATLISSKSEIVEGEVVNKMTSQQMADLKSTIQRDYSGIKNYRKTHFTNGETVIQNYGDTLIETEAVNAENAQWKNIFTTCGVPWVLSPAASSVSENSVIVGFKSLVTNTVLPINRKFDQKLNQKIQQWWPDVIAAHDVTEYSELAPDLKLMKEVYGSPLLYENERRSIFGYDELPKELNTILVQSGMMPLSDLLSSFEVDDNAEEL